MACLRNLASERCVTPNPKLLVGRSRGCHLQLESPLISAQHAEIRWQRGRWRLKDLGSRNGTYLNGLRVELGLWHRLRPGDEIWLGSPQDAWVLTDASCPQPVAYSDDGRVVGGRQELLQLPDETRPLASVSRRDGDWIFESPNVCAVLRNCLGDADCPQTVPSENCIPLGNQTWRIWVPALLDSSDETQQAPSNLRWDQLTLEFLVSPSEEQLEVTLRAPQGHRTPLAPRSHHHLLLYLARARLADARSELPRSEQGWRFSEDCARALGVSREKLNLDVCRARRQLTDAGVLGGPRMIERDPSSACLRLGITALEVRSDAAD